MRNEIFEHEYDLAALELIQPRGHDFQMYVTPRYRCHYQDQEYERYTARLLAQVLKRHSLFIDIGANYGFFAFLAATQHPQLEILALEPVEETFEALSRSARQLGLPNLHLQRAAAADADGTAHFNISMAADNCSFYPHPAAPPLRQVEVRTVRIDTLLDGREPQPTLVKMDVDGHELAVLRGMKQTLALFRDLTLLVEFNPKMLEAAGAKPEDLLRELDGLGFALFLLDDEQCQPCRLQPDASWTTRLARSSYANLYCVRKEAALSICFFSQGSSLAGAERSLLELVEEMTGDYGAVCSVVLPGSGPLREAMEKVGAACIPADYGWWGALPGESPGPKPLDGLVPQMKSVLRDVLPRVSQIDPDVIWTQTIVIPWGAVTAALLGKPHVWSVCEYGERDHGVRFFAPFDQILEEVQGSSSFIYTAGGKLGEALFGDRKDVRWAALERHIAIPDPSPQPVTTGLFTRPGALRLGLFASYQAGKGQTDAIAAVAELVGQGRDVELLLAGYSAPGEQLRLNELAAQWNVADRVRMPGFIVDRFEAMREAEVLLVCSRCEAFGRAGIEAMLLGKPVVYSNTGGLLDHMTDGATGLAYPPGDSHALAAAIRRLADDVDLRARLGRAAQAYARARFTRDNYGGEVYRRLKALLRAGQVPLSLPRLMQPVESAARIALDRDRQAQLPRRGLAGLGRKLTSAPELNRFFTRYRNSLKKRGRKLRNLLNRARVRLPITARWRRIRREAEVVRRSQLLDARWYWQKYPDPISKKTDAVLHYLLHGAARGCNPNPAFDSAFYARQNPEVAAAGLNPLVHYLEEGAKRGRQPNPLFQPQLYLEANPDVAASGLDPLAHYLQTGIKERRKLRPDKPASAGGAGTGS